MTTIKEELRKKWLWVAKMIANDEIIKEAAELAKRDAYEEAKDSRTRYLLYTIKFKHYYYKLRREKYDLILNKVKKVMRELGLL